MYEPSTRDNPQCRRRVFQRFVMNPFQLRKTNTLKLIVINIEFLKLFDHFTNYVIAEIFENNDCFEIKITFSIHFIQELY